MTGLEAVIDDFFESIRILRSNTFCAIVEVVAPGPVNGQYTNNSPFHHALKVTGVWAVID